MHVVPVGEFKANFSDILRKVLAGEEIGISYGKRRGDSGPVGAPKRGKTKKKNWIVRWYCRGEVY